MSSLQRVRDQQLDRARYSLYQRAIWIAIVGNGLLVLAKGTAALMSGSTAVLATAVDSLTDAIYTAFLAWGLWLSQQPADESHPQGHGRIEPVVSVAIGLAMGTAGLEVIKRAVSLLLGEPASFEWAWPAARLWPATVLAGSALVKVVMYRLVRRIGETARSPAIRAAAMDNLTDVLSSTVALAGVLAASWIHPLADPIAGIVVCLWIFRNAISILVENVGYLTGRAPAPELLEQIRATASGVPGVDNVHRIVADHVGPQLRVDMDVDVEAEIPFHVAHDISDAVRVAVEQLEEVDQAFVHLEPVHPP